MLEAPEQDDSPQATTRVMVSARLASLSSAGACKLLKRGISSQAIGPLGDYLGLGKGVIAESLDLDRSTLGCFDFEASKVMQRMGSGLRGVTSWRTEHKFRPNHITF